MSYPDLKRRIAANLWQVFEDHNYTTIRKMADDLHVSEGQLGRIMQGKRPIGHVDLLLALKTKLKVTLDWLIKAEPEPHYALPLRGIDKAERVRRVGEAILRRRGISPADHPSDASRAARPGRQNAEGQP